MNSTTKTIIVIGAGAAGLFSAIHNKLNFPKASVIILEKSSNVLSKVKISGGGRCNVTHACFEPKQLIEHYPRGKKELLSCFYKFQPQDTMNWFEAEGVQLKIESDNRVFPCSNSSQTIIDCLLEKAKKLNITIQTKIAIESVSKQQHQFIIQSKNTPIITCDKLILATGSNPLGHTIAKHLGHTIIKPIPSLFTFKLNDNDLTSLSGLSVKNTTCTLTALKKQPQCGPLLITHWGLSGPAIIKLSAIHAEYLYQNHYKTPLTINWLPQLTYQDILDQLTAIRQTTPNKQLQTHCPFSTIPLRLWHYLLKKTTIPVTQSWTSLTPKQTQKLSQTLTQTNLTITGKGVFKEEFVTCGGVALNEINFSTMESKCCENLHIIGECLNIDGLTGGFNFQNAWTTAFFFIK